MKENKYDDAIFFDKYSQMDRSQKGLEGAGEWETLQKMLPEFSDKRVLDLGCGYGWHCLYALENGAKSAVGIDISEKMLAIAKEKTQSDALEYLCMPIEDIDFDENTFDVILSSLAFHYIDSFDALCKKINHCLVDGGSFVFSVEHPIFTAYGTQDWYYGKEGKILHWPVDNYFIEGKRDATFLGERVLKYHKTLTTYINTLLQNGFELKEIIEPEPNEEQINTLPLMKDELRRPMMLLVSAIKKN